MKTKWIKLICDLELEQIADCFLSTPIKKSNDFGFDASALLDESLEAVFYERVIEKQKYHLPDGTAVENEIQKVTLFDFVVYKAGDSKYYVCVIEPPRTLKGFTNRIREIIGKHVFYSNIELNVGLLVNSLISRTSVTQVKITDLSISNLVLNGDSVIELKLKSKKDALEAVKTNFPDKEFVIKNIRVAFFYDKKVYDFKATKAGTIELPEIMSSEILDMVKVSVV